MAETVDVLVVGGGYAGAATAWQLAKRGARRIVVVEMEPRLAVHSSGRNAALTRRVVYDAPIAPLAREGAAWLENGAEGLPGGLAFRRTGALIVGSGAQWKALQASVDAARAAGTDARALSPAEARRLHPYLADASFEGAAFAPGDGILDPHALAAGFVAAARALGVEVRLEERLTAIESAGGRITGATTTRTRYVPRTILNAAGAWAGVVGRLADAAPIAIRPLRRHIFVTKPVPGVNPDWPFFWDDTNLYYHRPEAGGLMLSACDEELSEPGDCQVAPGAEAALRARLAQFAPKLKDLPIDRAWAGHRTFAEDRHFVIGWDPQMAGFFWLAGLGGHGLTVSLPVAKLAAEGILRGPGSDHPDFSPGRFALAARA